MRLESLFSSTHSSKSYIIDTSKKTWREAHSFCRQYHTDLISVRNQTDNQLIHNIINDPHTSVWIGLFRGSWEWSDNTDSAFRYWDSGQPDNSGSDCTVIKVNNEWKWHDVSCSDSYTFVCHEDELILIQKNLSWTEAVRYCKENHVDLVSVDSQKIQLMVTEVLHQASTAEVWLGQMPRLSAAEKQRRYRARRDADPAKREAYLAKGRQKWREKREQGAYYMPICEQSEREKRAKRKAWRRAQEQSRRRKKQASAIVTPPLSPDSEEQPLPQPGRQRIQGRRTRRRRYQKIYIENHKLKEKLKAQTKTSDKYRKRYERLLCSVDSPSKRTKRMLGTSPVSNDVRRTLVYHHALVKSLKQKFQCAAKEKTRNLIARIVSGKILKKYRFQKIIHDTLGVSAKRFCKNVNTNGDEIACFASKKYISTHSKLQDQVVAFYTRDDRTADRLVSQGEDISTAKHLFNALVKTNTAVKIFYIEEATVEKAIQQMPQLLPAVPCTMRIHQVITQAPGKLTYRDVSCLCSTRQILQCQCYQAQAFDFKVNSAVPALHQGQPDLEVQWDRDDIVGQWCVIRYDDEVYPGTIVEIKCKVKGTSYANGMLVIQRYTKRQLQLGEIASVVIKSETTVLLFLRGKTASWVPELGVYEIDKNSSDKLICESLDKLNDYVPLSFYHRGYRRMQFMPRPDGRAENGKR
ncbi:C-type lectin domain family 4 member M CD209 antigen-like protein 1 [Triplophysa tibetana]|uniref:C-type lectin domain family 4 member M CD209 antigen-like protein 1 n=1 Tax=Triplophysa tibetana TaxID=1572043 RepID=A0A5A9PFV0_9TELE|nr:C-type lectin domain family 4 member M CD209 antigen-like protein 1 [Triplophysa tibetana]